MTGNHVIESHVTGSHVIESHVTGSHVIGSHVTGSKKWIAVAIVISNCYSHQFLCI